MSSARPLPQAVEDGRIHFGERSRTCDVPVIVSPTPDDGVEQSYQRTGLRLLVGLDEPADFIQKGTDVLSRRLD